MGFAGRLRGFLVEALLSWFFGGWAAGAAFSGVAVTLGGVLTVSVGAEVAGASFLKIFLSALSTAFSYK